MKCAYALSQTPPELTVLESIHCPTCSAHYGLKASRVRIGIRRAHCFRCSTIFNIEQEVLRLAGRPEAFAEVGIGPEDLLDLQPQNVEVPVPAEELELPASSPEDTTPSLTLGDLEGADEEILEKTLVVEGEQVHPETTTPVISASPEGASDELEFETTGSGYSSAKDAIDKLLGNLPPLEAAPERRSTSRTAAQMDVEATLDALASTLGGVTAKEPGTKPDLPAPVASQPEPETPRSISSTLKLTHDEIASAMKAASAPIAAPIAHPPAPTPRPVAVQPQPEADATLLKLQVGQEVYNNVSMEQITAWIEQGRVQDFHMVARQFSENWIEAGKIPSLRPVFERIRRQQTPTAQQAQAVVTTTAPVKRSLFGGLFHRG